MIKAVLFDMDGVLIDSEVIYLNSLVKCLASIGIEERVENLSNLTGMKSDQITRTLIKRYNLKQLSLETLMKMQDDYFDAEVEQKKLSCMEGVIEFLERIKSLGIKTALASSSDYAWISTVIDTLEIRSYFDVIIGAEQVTHSKPHPEIFLKAATALQVHPSQCLVIEDSVNGIAAGKRAHMQVIGFKGSKVNQDTSNADREVYAFQEIELVNIENIAGE